MKLKATMPQISHQVKTEDVIKNGKVVDRIHHITEIWEFDIIIDQRKQKKKKK